MVQLHLIWLLFITCYLWLAIWIFLSETWFYLQKLVSFRSCFVCLVIFFSHSALHFKIRITFSAVTNKLQTAICKQKLQSANCNLGSHSISYWVPVSVPDSVSDPIPDWVSDWNSYQVPNAIAILHSALHFKNQNWYF